MPKHPGGRPSKYTNDTLNLCREYLEDHEAKGDPVPSHAGLAVFLDVTKSTIYKWAEDKPEFSDMLERIKQKQEQILLAHGLLNTFNPTITKLMLAKHDYSDKSEIDNKHSGEVSFLNDVPRTKDN